MKDILRRTLAGLTVLATSAAIGGPALASSHAEAPLISMTALLITPTLMHSAASSPAAKATSR
ncbi:MAG: hypothetical protein ABIR33_13120 [Pyrinomonadaceae bacterium]